MPRKGQPISDAHRKAIADANRRRVFTPQMRENASRAHRGQKLSEETKKKLSVALSGEKNPFWGKHHTKETRERISRANTGMPGYNKGRKLSVETRAKIAAARRGTKSSQETRDKISKALRGRKMPDGFGKKVSDGLKKSDKFKAWTDYNRGANASFYGHHHTEESKKKLSAAKIGHPSPNRGVPHTKKTRAKMREAAKHRPPVSEKTKKLMSETRRGEKNGFWGKHHSEKTKRKLRGKNNAQWKGGHNRNHQYGPEWDSVRKQIRIRDNHRCMLCSATEFGYWHVPDVHHIIPFFDAIKLGIENPHDFRNLISLCRSCHTKSDKILQHSIKQFREMLSSLYGYDYGDYALDIVYTKLHPIKSTPA